MAQCVEIDRGILTPAAENSPDCALVLISGGDYLQLQTLLEQSPNSIDYTECAGIFSFFFSTTMIFWLLAKKVGLVVRAVRHL
jgi:hypothetical protein